MPLNLRGQCIVNLRGQCIATWRRTHVLAGQPPKGFPMRSPVSVARTARLCAAVCSLVVLALLPGAVAQAIPPQITVYGTTAASNAGATFAGGTIAVSSTTRLDDGATVTGNIVDNGTLLFNQSAGNLLTISSTISGTGTLTLMNSGTLQLTGTTGSVAIPSSGTRGLIPLNLTTNVNSGVLTGALSGTSQNTIFQLGVGGTGTLNIAGGLVTGTQWNLGVGTGDVGTVNVSSGTLGPRGGLMIGGVVSGTGGSGTLNITGGLVGDTAFLASSLTGASRLGAGVGSTGLLTLTSGTFGTSNAIYIGDVGTGTMTVNSGYLKLNQGFIGYSSGAQGTVNLLGGTTANGSKFQVGGTGSGSLTINASLVQARQTEIGFGAGSSGTVTVTSGTYLNNGVGSGNQADGYVKIGVSGTGSLTINSGGYVVASGTVVRGANGTLTLNQGGTLQIGSQDGSNNPFTMASGTAGALVGDLTYAGTLKFAQDSNYTYADKLSGSGDLIKTGSGTLTLTGSNSFTGGTMIEQGKISLGNADALGTTGTISFSTSGTLAPGALQFTASNTTDYSSRFSTAANQRYAVDSNGQDVTLASNLTSSGGSFTKFGSGSVTLTGANTFTTGSVAAGTLIGTASSLATTGTFGVASGGELRFDQATSGTWAGAMAGSGTFTKIGAGALTLSGSTSNTNGSLVVSAGSVIGTTHTIRRAVTNNAQVTFNQAVTGTYSSVMSGSGVLVKDGVGTLALTGNNTFTGNWTLTSGTLSLGSANALGTSGTISFEGGTLQSTGSNTADYSARFSNAANQQYRIDTNGQFNVTLASALTSSGGSLTKVGSGTATLSGANTYSGGTTVSAGRLFGTTTSLQGAIVNNANVAFSQLTSGTYSGNMSGSGSLTKLGTGTVTLTGSNSYTGGTTVAAGRLIGTTSSIRGAINITAAISFDQSFDGTYSSNITGSGPGGSLTKLGSGVVTLTGSNSYTQGTTLTDGTLALGSANAIGPSGTITFNGGTLRSTASNTTDYSARFSNAASQQYRIDTNGQNLTLASNLTSTGGSFTKLGTGTVTLTGTNSYSGGTTVSAGSLIGTTKSLQGGIVNNAAVAFSQTTTGTYSGAMSGTGSLEKLGSGTVTLTGTSTHSGATTVSAGVLVVNGKLTNSAVTVGSGGKLGGRGRIDSSLTVQSGGTLSPGNSPGQLSVGALDLQAGSATLMEIIGSGSAAGTAGTDFDQILVSTGTIALGGMLDLVFGNTTPFADGTFFQLFDFSGAKSGSFASVLSSGSGSYAGLSFSGVGGVWTGAAAGQTLTFDEATGRLVFSASTPSGVPEIDPRGLGTALALVAGALGMAERRLRRLRLARPAS